MLIFSNYFILVRATVDLEYWLQDRLWKTHRTSHTNTWDNLEITNLNQHVSLDSARKPKQIISHASLMLKSLWHSG